MFIVHHTIYNVVYLYLDLINEVDDHLQILTVVMLCLRKADPWGQPLFTNFQSFVVFKFHQIVEINYSLMQSDWF